MALLIKLLPRMHELKIYSCIRGFIIGSTLLKTVKKRLNFFLSKTSKINFIRFAEDSVGIHLSYKYQNLTITLKL